MFSTGWLSRLHKPGENEQLYPERMKEHLNFTKGKVFTRFPPEPNGYLHVSFPFLSRECVMIDQAHTKREEYTKINRLDILKLSQSISDSRNIIKDIVT